MRKSRELTEQIYNTCLKVTFCVRTVFKAVFTYELKKTHIGSYLTHCVSDRGARSSKKRNLTRFDFKTGFLASE